MALRLTLKNQSANMGSIQEFETQEDLNKWIKQHGSDGTNLLPNAVLSGKKLTFDSEAEGGGTGTVTNI